MGNIRNNEFNNVFYNILYIIMKTSLNNFWRELIEFFKKLSGTTERLVHSF